MGMDMQVQKALVKMPNVVVRGWRGPLMGLLKHIGRSYTAALAKDLPGLIQSFVLAAKVLEDTVCHALTMLQENKSIKALVARGQLLRGDSSRNQQAQTGTAADGSARGMALAAVTAFSGAAASAGGAVC